MTNKNLLSERDRELQEFAEQYEKAKAENKPYYLDADDMAELANWYGLKKEFDKALDIAEYGVRLHPESTALHVELAYLLLDNEQKERAFQIAEKIEEKDLPEVKVLRARLLLSIDKKADAEKLLDTIEEKDSLANMVEVAYMYLDAGYPDRALEWLRPGIKKYANDEAYMAVRGDSYYAKGMIKPAAALYNKLIDQDPYSAPYWFGLAKCYFEQKKYDKAIEACDYALIGDDEYADVYVLKGHCFYQLGNEEEALKCYQQAKKYNGIGPDFIYTYIGLGHVTKGEWKEGYENLEKAIETNTEGESNPNLSSLYANAGLCLSKMGKKRKAHQYCKKAHLLSPEDPGSYLIEGRIYIEEGDFEKGLEQWTKAINYSPNADTWHEMGMHSMEIGQLDYAKMAFEQVRKLNPKFESINEKLTIVYLALHDKKNFLKYNKKCIHPINMEELEMMQQVLTDENHEELASYIQKMLKTLK